MKYVNRIFTAIGYAAVFTFIILIFMTYVECTSDEYERLNHMRKTCSHEYFQLTIERACQDGRVTPFEFANIQSLYFEYGETSKKELMEQYGN